MDYNTAQIVLELQYIIQEKHEIDSAREDLILREKQQHRIKNKKLIQKMISTKGIELADLARGLSALNLLFQNTELSLAQIFDGLSEELDDIHPREALAVEQLWIYCDSVDA